MGGYTDGFVIVMPENKLEAYRAMAEKAGAVWREHGALDFKECAGEDLDQKEHCASFPAALGAKTGETVMFSWISYESREHRDQVNARVMEDPRIKNLCSEGDMPFDPKRMLYGGFKVIVEA